MDKRYRSRSNATITDTNTKNSPAVVTPDVNSYNRQSHKSCRSTNMNDENTVESGNETELLCTRVTLLLKVPMSNNSRNTTQKLLQDFLVQIQQSDRRVVFIPWYSSNNKSFVAPIKRPENVYQDFQALQTYYTRLNPKQHTKQ